MTQYRYYIPLIQAHILYLYVYICDHNLAAPYMGGAEPWQAADRARARPGSGELFPLG